MTRSSEMFGAGDPTEVVARVRYEEFKERSDKSNDRLFSPSRLQRISISAPSGHQYSFRQKGQPSNPNSQWLPITRSDAAAGDLQFFEESDGYEVRDA